MLSPNTVLQNRYRIVRELGRGGMGAVYEAIDQRLSRTVALKETLVDSEELLRAFEREARLLANLRHPALPKVIDHFIEGDGQYLVMEFIPGDDLADMLEKRGRPFSSDEVMRWTDELLDALDYLHSHEPPIVHRDIKPHNLKLTAQGRIVLLDFGLAKGAAGEMTRVGSGVSVLGYTPHYASLEQIQGERTNSRSDLYSLAATLFNLLTNRVPVDALKRATELINDEADPLPPIAAINPAVPPELAVVLGQALSLKPSERPASASAMRAALHNPALLPTAVDDERTVLRSPDFAGSAARRVELQQPGSMPPAAPFAPDGGTIHSFRIDPENERQRKRNRILLIAGTIATLLAIVGFGAFLMLRPRETANSNATPPTPTESIPSPFREAIPAVAAVTVYDANGTPLRQVSGVFIRPDEVATSLTAIEGAARGRVSLIGKSGSFEIGNVTGFDPARQLVTFKVNGAKSTPLPASSDKRTTLGDKIGVLGGASQYREAQFYEPSFVDGSVTGYRDNDQIELRLSGPAAPGSPVLNSAGELIGLATVGTGGNSNQALAVPVVYLAEMANRKLTPFSLAGAGAKEIIFDFRSEPDLNTSTVSKEIESRVMAAVRNAHGKPAQTVTPPPANTNIAEEPQPLPSPEIVVKDEFSEAVVSGSAQGSFTAAGAHQTAYIIDTRSGSHADNFGPKYLAIFNGDTYLFDVPLKDYSFILKTIDLNRDGISELLLTYGYMQMGIGMEWAELVDLTKDKKLRVIKDFGLVTQSKCGDEPSVGPTSSVIYYGPAVAGQFPEFRVDNFEAPCEAEGTVSSEWKYTSTGKMQQKF